MRRLSMIGLILNLALFACSSDSESFERPVAKPGQIITVVDQETPEVPKEATLQDFAVGSDGTIFAALTPKAGRGSSRIIAVPKKGKPRILVDEAGFFPTAVALDLNSKTLYVLDSAEDRIRAIDESGKRRNLAQFGGGRAKGPGNPEFDDATWLAVEPRSGTLYVADQCQVVRIRDDEVVVVAGATPDPCSEKQFDEATLLGGGRPALEGETYGAIGGIAVDPEGNELLIAVGPAGVFRINEAGVATLATLARKTPEPPLPSNPDNPRGQLSGGSIVFSSKTKELFVTETDQGLILRISFNGVIERVAGNGERSGDPEDKGDGKPALDARLIRPRRLGVDGDNNVYVHDDRRSPAVRMIGAKA